MQSLVDLNNSVSELLVILNKTPVEDESTDKLVLNLLELVGKRQLLLASIFETVCDEDAPELRHQLVLTQEFEAKAKIIQAARQSLLYAGRKSQRQLNVYTAIDTNR